MSDISVTAYKNLISGDFLQAVTLYEQAIILDPKIKANYAYLGLLMLLQERELDAQMIWFSVVEDLEDLDEWKKELQDILNAEAERYSNQSEIVTAWLIRQHLAEISPENLYNLTKLVSLSLEQPLLDPQEQNLASLVEMLEIDSCQISPQEIIALQNLLEQIIVAAPSKKIDTSISISKFGYDKIKFNRAVIDTVTTELQLSISLMKAYFDKLEEAQRSESVNAILLKLEDVPTQVQLVYNKVCLSFFPDSPNMLRRFYSLLKGLDFYRDSAEIALQVVSKSQYTIDQFFGYLFAVNSFLCCGLRWEEAQTSYFSCSELLKKIIQSDDVLELLDSKRILNYILLGCYLSDSPVTNQIFSGKLGAYYQYQIRRSLGDLPILKNPLNCLTDQNKKLRIGYIAERLYRHSVGWLSRWIFLNHDYTKFDVIVYSLTKQEDNIQSLIKHKVTKFVDITVDSDADTLGVKSIAEEIQNDNIDILIDLDSLTSIHTCEIMAHKPAPIQITWLGYDASGIPAIDYFIADPYILPDNADSYYANKIWRLPQTYVAVNGFEVGIPDLRRNELSIPQDAIVYLSVQSPYKRNPNVLRQQMKILRQVPNSYFLIKSINASSDFEAEAIQIALEEEVSPEKLRFLPSTSTEEIHRANYAIADVILDTYPYNGATTTLEALWMCIPIVTRVGEQFAARNSYTMMINAGITEGIAWSDQEYIDWGIRLGTDENLRKQIFWKLKESRKTAPLWNVKQFTKEMESAYQQMWKLHIQSKK